MNSDNLTDHILEKSNGSYAQSVREMIACMKLMPIQLPEVGAMAMVVATQYWESGVVSESDLEQARVKCWAYLDEHAMSFTFDEPTACGLRAVICVLHPTPPSADIAELVTFFSLMMQHAIRNDCTDDF